MSSDPFPANEPVLLVAPAGVDGLKVRSAVVAEALGQPFRIDLELLGPPSFVSASKVMGQPMTLLINIGEGARYFNGLVSEFQFIGTQARSNLYRVVLRPWVWFLSRTINCRIFQRQTVLDIIKQVLRPHVSADIEIALEPRAPREFVVQYRESDLTFATRLMEEEGLYYYFQHLENRHVLVLCQVEQSHEPAAGFEALPFFPVTRQRATFVPHIDGWEVTHRVEANAYASNDFDFIKPGTNLLVRSALPANAALGELERFHYPGEYQTFGEGESRARVRLDEQQALTQRCEAHAYARTVYCGNLLGMTGHPVEEYNDQYLVVSTTLRLRGHDQESGNDALEGIGRCNFVAIPAKTSFALARTTPKPNMLGVQTAIVTGPAGSQIWSDSHGRVKVKFHWDRDAKAIGDAASCWVRVSQLWAGAGFGGIHVPRVGEEVIVEFLEGDPDRPIITGRVYNGLNVPPYELPKHQTQSGIKTSTEFGEVDNFNELRFEDAKGNEEIYIQAERNKTVKVKRSRSASIGGSDTVAVGGNRSVSVTGDLNVTVGAKGGKYKLEATKTADVVAPDYIELKCQNTVLRLTPDSITLTAGTKGSIVIDDRVFAQSKEGSSVLLDTAASVASKDGAQVLVETGIQATGEEITVEGKTLVDIKASLVKINS